MRNQNVYSGQITQGLVVSSPQTSKVLKPYVAADASSVSTFVVEVQNRTAEARWFRLRIVGQPVGGRASLLPLDDAEVPREARDTLIPPHSGASHTVFATSVEPAATIHLEVAEITGPAGDLVPGGLASFLVLNADPTVPLLQNVATSGRRREARPCHPTSNPASQPSISNQHPEPVDLQPNDQPLISNPSISDQHLESQRLGSQHLNPRISDHPRSAGRSRPCPSPTSTGRETGDTSASYR
jgi:hypothetical protein